MSQTAASDPNRRSRLPHLELLVALVSLLVIQSFLSPDNDLHRSILNALFFLTLLTGIRSLSRSRIRLWTTLSLGAAGYAFSLVDEFWGSDWWVTLANLSYVALCGLLISVLCQSVFGQGPINADRIIGAIVIYFLIGLIWAFVYTLIELIHPGSFDFNLTAMDQSQPNYVSEFIYFSYVTLTTLGYGDCVPVSPPARMLAMLQAITGQLYVAIVIARLVGLYLAPARK